MPTKAVLLIFLLLSVLGGCSERDTEQGVSPDQSGQKLQQESQGKKQGQVAVHTSAQDDTVAPADNDLGIAEKPASYAASLDDRSVELVLSSQQGQQGLRADMSIAMKDGTGAVFELQNAVVVKDGKRLKFRWKDGFGNKGSAILAPADRENATVLTLSADEVLDLRPMRFMDSYLLENAETVNRE